MIDLQLHLGLTSILFQRGLYPPEDWTSIQKYGLRLQTPADPALASYLSRVVSQLENWILASKVCCLVLVFTDTNNGNVVERWHFDLNLLGEKENTTGEKDIKCVNKEIAALLKQITASCSFLPLIEPSTTTFNVLGI
jgi:mitotic spindle assembly checkpoint protein MAD2